MTGQHAEHPFPAPAPGARGEGAPEPSPWDGMAEDDIRDAILAMVCVPEVA